MTLLLNCNKVFGIQEIWLCCIWSCFIRKHQQDLRGWTILHGPTAWLKVCSHAFFWVTGLWSFKKSQLQQTRLLANVHVILPNIILATKKNGMEMDWSCTLKKQTMLLNQVCDGYKKKSERETEQRQAGKEKLPWDCYICSSHLILTL